MILMSVLGTPDCKGHSNCSHDERSALVDESDDDRNYHPKGDHAKLYSTRICKVKGVKF